MRFKRDFFENLIAEVIARFVIGFGAAALFGFALLRRFWRYWDEMGWQVFLIPAAVGLLFAVLGVRKGPGAI